MRAAAAISSAGSGGETASTSGGKTARQRHNFVYPEERNESEAGETTKSATRRWRKRATLTRHNAPTRPSAETTETKRSLNKNGFRSTL